MSTMTLDLPPSIREELVQFRRRNDIDYLALFGSASRGDMRPDSDVDLLVEFAPKAQIGFLALAKMQREP